LKVKVLNETIAKEFMDGKLADYSGNITSAMEVFEVLRNSGKWCCLDISSDHHYVWDIRLIKAHIEGSNDYHKPCVSVCDEDLAMAICRAAIKGLEIE
jgi:hypothetical protein